MTPFKNVHHICIAIEDIERAMPSTSRSGSAPWHDYPDLTAFTDLDVPSAEGFHKLIYKWTMIGDLQLQLVEAGPDGMLHMGEPSD